MIYLLSKKQLKKLKKKYPQEKFYCGMDWALEQDPMTKAFYGDGTIKDETTHYSRTTK